MNISLFTPEVFRFINEYEQGDPYKLILSKKEVNGIPAKILAEQVIARQKMKIKAPEWHKAGELIYPTLKAVEQASSEITAKYKAELLKGETIIDLTGGLGIDTWAFAKKFTTVGFNDSDRNIVSAAIYNFNKLRSGNISFTNSSAEDYLKTSPSHADAYYMDPSRRRNLNIRKWKIEDSSPNIFTIVPVLSKYPSQIMVKLSPRIDLKYILKNLTGCHSIHIVAVENECRELLLLIKGDKVIEPQIVTIDIAGDKRKIFEGNYELEQNIKPEISDPGKFIYEPNAAIQKSGLFRLIGYHYHLTMLHSNTHLYSSEQFIPDFPGRIFKVSQIYPVYDFFRKKPVNKASVITRNFPLEVNEIRKKGNIEEDPSVYVIATTDSGNRLIIIIAERIFSEK